MNEYTLRSQVNAYGPHLQQYVNNIIKLKKTQDKAVAIWGGRPGVNDPFLMARIAEAMLIFSSSGNEINISSLACHLNIGRTRLYRVLKILETNGLYVLKKIKTRRMSTAQHKL